MLLLLCRAGTVVDNSVCHPRTYDFYMCAHAGMIVSTTHTCLLGMFDVFFKQLQ